jgi:hypothetical protein
LLVVQVHLFTLAMEVLMVVQVVVVAQPLLVKHTMLVEWVEQEHLTQF